ncbi:MAG: response regulator [Rubrivivax sp.]|nr:response regulator [Rubrivivax sp.]
MLTIDAQVHKANALVVDANPTSRSVVSQQLRDLGFGQVRHCLRPRDALGLVENRPFDLIVCDEAFDANDATGQELLEEMRRERLLPYSTVFVMLTSEATYQKVAEAAEAALDSYLIRPFSANALFERLREARHRKREMNPIFKALEENREDDAIALCMHRFRNRDRYWLYAARVAAELLLSQNRNAEARELYDAVIAAKTVPWARLGVARAQQAQGDLAGAQNTLAGLIDQEPQYADSYDVLGKVQMEQGKLDEALATYRTAAKATPGDIQRLQRSGTMSFFAGQMSEAKEQLERAWSLGQKSRLFDDFSLALLALLHFDLHDGKALAHIYDTLSLRLQRASVAGGHKARRLQRFTTLAEALVQLHNGRSAQGTHLARQLAEECNETDFDFEACSSVVALWSRLPDHGVGHDEVRTLFSTLARRHASARSTTEMLVSAARPLPEADAWLREAHAEVSQLAERAMNLSLRGQPSQAMQLLLQNGRSWNNAKLVERAKLVGQRHRERIEGIDVLMQDVDRLMVKVGGPPPSTDGRPQRAAGGLVLHR